MVNHQTLRSSLCARKLSERTRPASSLPAAAAAAAAAAPLAGVVIEKADVHERWARFVVRSLPPAAAGARRHRLPPPLPPPPPSRATPSSAASRAHASAVAAAAVGARGHAVTLRVALSVTFPPRYPFGEETVPVFEVGVPAEMACLIRIWQRRTSKVNARAPSSSVSG